MCEKDLLENIRAWHCGSTIRTTKKILETSKARLGTVPSLVIRVKDKSDFKKRRNHFEQNESRFLPLVIIGSSTGGLNWCFLNEALWSPEVTRASDIK